MCCLLQIVNHILAFVIYCHALQKQCCEKKRYVWLLSVSSRTLLVWYLTVNFSLIPGFSCRMFASWSFELTCYDCDQKSSLWSHVVESLGDTMLWGWTFLWKTCRPSVWQMIWQIYNSGLEHAAYTPDFLKTLR